MSARRPSDSVVRCSRLGVFAKAALTVAISSLQASRSGSNTLSHASATRTMSVAAAAALPPDISRNLTVLPNELRLSCGALNKEQSFRNLRAPPASSAC